MGGARMTLYPRRPGPGQWPGHEQRRLKAYAHRLLDRARAGRRVEAFRIEWALKVTGDA